MKHLFGARLTPEGAEFKVWAPAARKVELVLGAEARRRSVRMEECDEHVFYARTDDIEVGIRYRYRLNDGGEFPDPYSRFQPEGPHGFSMLVDANAYRWLDRDWRGVEMPGQIIYELHIGAFTPEGTFAAAEEKLEYLRDLGITLVEIMPISEFPGRWNWGYDGVNLFAPYHGYGDYDACKRFVDRAHALGLGVILDVVYNHIGPDGNYLPSFSPHYFSTLHKNEWGTPFNVDGEQSARVRQFIVDNACAWIREFHMDGLRLDATSNIPDYSARHILEELTEETRSAAGVRKIVIIAEDEQQHGSRLRDPATKGFGLDGMWNDDFHHSAYVALTGRRHAYYYDYTGAAQEFISAIKRGFLFQGQFYQWQKQPRGEPVRTWAPSMVTFLENHDQVANSLRGARLCKLSDGARLRALTTLLLLAPHTPLLFMGQEFDASTPFLFFADHNPELRALVRSGRRDFLAQFPSVAGREASALLDDPGDETSFQRSKLDWREQAQHTETQIFFKELLALRKSDPVIRKQDARALDGAVLSMHAFALRWFDAEHGDRLLLVNSAEDRWLNPGPEPLLAPSMNRYWSLLWSSERTRYGGFGVEHPEIENGWYIPGQSAILLCEAPIGAALRDAS